MARASPMSKSASVFSGFYNPDAGQSSFVNLAPVTDSRHLHQQFRVVDGVHHAVVPHTNAPLAITAPELLAARRTGIGSKVFQARNDARDPFAGQFLEFLLRARRQRDAVPSPFSALFG